MSENIEDSKEGSDRNYLAKEKFFAEGMVCDSCASIVERQVMAVDGVKNVSVDYASKTGYVEFDKNKTSIEEIFRKVEEKGYECSLTRKSKPTNYEKLVGYVCGGLGIFAIAYFIFNYVGGIEIPQISSNMGYGLLFLIGLLTGFHCVSMCGGFVISYTTKNAQEGKKPHNSHLMYALGKIVSYTVIGAFFGFVGSIFAFTPLMRGIAGVLAGLFLILFGLKMLDFFPALRKLQLKTPRFLQKFVGKTSKENASPLVIGLLNGLMIACGPLQAIYITAAGTGSVVEGGKLLFMFALGTLPVMLGFGYLTSYLSAKFTNKILRVSGAVVIILGLIMFNRGLVLTGSGYDFESLVTPTTGDTIKDFESITSIKNGVQEIRMEVNRYGWNPDKFVLKKGVPVRWVINGKEINGCNNAIQVPKLGLEFDIKKGEQVIEFTPEKEGKIAWSCWMGMIPGLFIVKEDIDLEDAESIEEELNSEEVPSGGSCGGSCGSSTCGAARGGGCGCGGR